MKKKTTTSQWSRSKVRGWGQISVLSCRRGSVAECSKRQLHSSFKRGVPLPVLGLCLCVCNHHGRCRSAFNYWNHLLDSFIQPFYLSFRLTSWYTGVRGKSQRKEGRSCLRRYSMLSSVMMRSVGVTKNHSLRASSIISWKLRNIIRSSLIRYDENILFPVAFSDFWCWSILQGSNLLIIRQSVTSINCGGKMNSKQIFPKKKCQKSLLMIRVTKLKRCHNLQKESWQEMIWFHWINHSANSMQTKYFKKINNYSEK